MKRTSDATIQSNSSPNPAAGALPGALDDSEEGAGLRLGRVGTHDESLASAEECASTDLALGALKSEGDLLGLLRLLAEDGLGLTTKATLLGSVATSALRLLGVLALFVLSNLEFLMLLALLAEGHLGLRSMHLDGKNRSDEVNNKTDAGDLTKRMFRRLTIIACLLINIKNLKTS